MHLIRTLWTHVLCWLFKCVFKIYMNVCTYLLHLQVNINIWVYNVVWFRLDEIPNTGQFWTFCYLETVLIVAHILRLYKHIMLLSPHILRTECMFAFNTNIHLSNRFATSIYLCYIPVYVPLCNIKTSYAHTHYT